MPRIRTIKPEFPQSESMGRVTRDARLLFIQLWTLADDSGRLRGNSRMLASLLFPYDDDAPSLIVDWLAELEAQNCIVRYLADDGGSYVQISNWTDHQKIDKASESKLPAPSDDAIREYSRKLSKPREASLLSRARADQGPRTKEGTKDQGEEGTKEDCNEVAAQPSLPPAVHVCDYPDFPCVKGKASDKQTWTATQTLVDRLSDVFTGVASVESEFRKAHAWIMANKSRRKTAAGMEDFLRRWLARENDRSNPKQRTFKQMSEDNTLTAAEEFASGS